MRWSRPLAGTPKTVTISREADGWYVCFSCADVPIQPLLPIQPLAPTGQETIGIDLGLESFATLADGTMIHTPRCSRRAERRLKTAQRKVSRRKKGSNRRKKAVKLLAKAHQKVKRQRQDFQHKTALAAGAAATTRSITKTCRRPTCSRTTTSPSPLRTRAGQQFLSILNAKAACAGRRVVAVPSTCLYQPDVFWLWRRGARRAYPSAGTRAQTCGTSLHRDHNAAKNRERLGQSRRGAVA